MELIDATKFVQQHFTDGLVCVIGSGLSVAEGMPGMPELSEHLLESAKKLKGAEASSWGPIASMLQQGNGLESTLLAHPPSEPLQAWIGTNTSSLLVPIEQEILSSVVKGSRRLRLTTFLEKILKPSNGLPILTTNYDRLIEVACEFAGFHVDTTAIGQYAGAFDPHRSCMASCRGIIHRGKHPMLDHFPRAAVLKPHGSLDWYESGGNPIRSSIELDCERLIITPGLNKYKAGYNIPFDKHRELANNHIDQAARLLIIGYGFNDDHLQQHLVPKIENGVPTLILTRTASPLALQLANKSSACVCLSKPAQSSGVAITAKGETKIIAGAELWDLEILSKELLV